MGNSRSCDPVGILHLSDLHFGVNCRIPFDREKAGDIAKILANSVKYQNQKCGVPPIPSLVIITGDLTQTAKPSEFRMAGFFLEALSIGFDITQDERWRFVIIPGNHDISRDACIGVENTWKSREQPLSGLENAMTKAKYKNYLNFIKKFYGDISVYGKISGVMREDLGSLGCIYDYNDIKLSVAALNSCHNINHSMFKGCFPSSESQKLLKAWENPTRNDYLKVVAIHHNPLPIPLNLKADTERYLNAKAKKKEFSKELVSHFVADTIGLDGADELKNSMEQCCAHAILHGHLHTDQVQSWLWRKPRVGQTFVFGSGSLGLKLDKLSKDECNQVRFILLDRQINQVSTYRIAYNPTEPTLGLSTLGAFIQEHRDDWELQHDLFHKAKGGTTGTNHELDENIEAYVSSSGIDPIEIIKSRYATNAPRPHLTPHEKDKLKYKIVAFDVDKTILRGFEYSWREVWRVLGVNKKVYNAARTKFCNSKQLYSDYLDWCQHDLDLMKSHNLDRKKFTEIVESARMTNNLIRTLDNLRNKGIVLAVISGGIDEFIIQKIPNSNTLFDYICVNKMKYDTSGLVEGIEATPFDYLGKAVALKTICDIENVSLNETVFVGEGRNDVDVAKLAGLSIFYSDCDDPDHGMCPEATHIIHEDDAELLLNAIDDYNSH